MRPRRLFTVVVILAGATAATGAAAKAQPGALGAPCLMMAGAGHAGCRTTFLTPLSRRPGEAAPEPIGFADFAAGYSLYRLLSATDPHRACRLQPTCSLFAAQAARRVGWWRGLLMGLARAQTAHTDQDGFLLRALAPDGQFIFLDPVDRWLRRAP